MRLLRVIVLAALVGLPASATAAPHLVRTLPNKMTLVVRENRTRPLVSIQAWVKAGQRDETREEWGTASVLARMLFEATKTRPPGVIESDLSLVGGSFGSEVGYGYALFQVLVPARSVGTGIDVLSDVVLHPRMDPKDLEQAIAKARVETRAVQAGPERVTINPAREALHPGTPLAAPLFVPELELASIRLAFAQRFYAKHYVAENMMIVVVGDVDPEDVARRVQMAFAGAPTAKPAGRARFSEKPATSARFLTVAPPEDTQGAAIAAAFRAPAWGTADAVALDVLMAVLVDSPISRAQKRLVEGGGEFVLAAAQRSFEAEGGTVALSLRVEPERMKEAESALITLIQQARATPVSQTELDAAVRSILARDLFSQAELPGLGRAAGLAYLQGRTGADEVYTRRVKAVRVEDLAAVAVQYLDLKKAAIVEVIASRTADSLELRQGLEKRFREKMGMHEAAHLQAPKVTQSSEQERRKRIDAPLEQIPATPPDAGRSRVARTVLSGGLRLATSEDRSVPIVTIGVYLGGGVRYEHDKNNGVTSLVREILLSSADPKAGGTAYRFSLAEMGRLSPYQDRDMWGVSLAVPADSWKDALGRLGAMFTHPDLDTVTVDATRIHVLTALDKWLDDDSAQRARLIFPTKYLVSGYRLPGLGTRKNLITMPLTDIEGWYRKFVVRGNVVVSVFGDVPADQVGPVVEAAFTDLSSRAFQPGGLAQEGEFEGYRERWELGMGPDCTVTLAFNGPPATSDDMPGMYVVNSLLSGPRGWFQQYLETDAFIKDATSIVSQAIDESPIIASVTVAGPVQEENAVRLLFRQFKKVAFLPLTGEMADSLRHAKTHAAGTFLSTLGSNTARAFQAGRDELFGLGVDNAVTLPAKMDRVTASDLEMIGRKYFEVDEMVRRPYAITETRPGGW